MATRIVTLLSVTNRVVRVTKRVRITNMYACVRAYVCVRVCACGGEGGNNIHFITRQSKCLTSAVVQVG